jgi:hypothetical protein
MPKKLSLEISDEIYKDLRQLAKPFGSRRKTGRNHYLGSHQ